MRVHKLVHVCIHDIYQVQMKDQTYSVVSVCGCVGDLEISLLITPLAYLKDQDATRTSINNQDANILALYRINNYRTCYMYKHISSSSNEVYPYESCIK